MIIQYGYSATMTSSKKIKRTKLKSMNLKNSCMVAPQRKITYAIRNQASFSRNTLCYCVMSTSQEPQTLKS